MSMKKTNMKSLVSMFFACAFMVLSLSACNVHVEGEYVEYATNENETLGCIELSRLDIVYRPYGVIPNNEFRGDQVGLRDDNPDSILCQVKGYSTSEWILEYTDVFMDGGDMLFKAVGVTDIPEELIKFKEYDY